MSLAAFIASQRTEHRVPHVVACRALDVSESWFYKWRDREPTPAQCRRAELDAKVAEIFEDSGGEPRTYGSPRVHAELRDQGWRVTEKTVAASMARQGLVARPKRRFRCLTRPDKRAVPFPDLVRRDFSALAPNVKWCGDMTEIPTLEGKLYLADVEDLFSRRIIGFAIGEHPDAELAQAAIQTAVAIRGGSVAGVIFHSDRGSTYTADAFTEACGHHKIRQSMGRTGSCLDNAAAESFFSTLEHELLSRTTFPTKEKARRRVAAWIDNYNRRRRHSVCGMKSPIDYEAAVTVTARAA
jgi:transposase InsO family protein